MIGGVAVLGAALIAALISLRAPAYPAIEVKDLTPSGEKVLARLAFAPTKQLVDSSAFARLNREDLLWNDTLGVAIRKPTSYEWGQASADSLEYVESRVHIFSRWLNSHVRHGFGDSLESRVRFFAVRLDQPVEITFSLTSLIDSTRVGHNPFKDLTYFLRWMRMNNGPEIDKAPATELAVAYREAIATLDSIGKADFPIRRRVLTGVFVARVKQQDLGASITPWVKAPLLDAAVGTVASGTPTMLVVDRDRETALFSTAVHLQGVLVDGKATPSVTINRAGYAIGRGKAVFVVMLQFASTQPASVLDELQRILESVRLRASER